MHIMADDHPKTSPGGPPPCIQIQGTPTETTQSAVTDPSTGNLGRKSAGHRPPQAYIPSATCSPATPLKILPPKRVTPCNTRGEPRPKPLLAPTAQRPGTHPGHENHSPTPQHASQMPYSSPSKCPPPDAAKNAVRHPPQRIQNYLQQLY